MKRSKKEAFIKEYLRNKVIAKTAINAVLKRRNY